MPDENDKILEAEKSIENIAEEMARLKNAATLLDNTQIQNENIINSAESVVEGVKTLVETFKEVVSNLSSLNINQRLSELENKVIQLSELTNKHAGDTSEVIAKTAKEVDFLKIQTQEIAKNSSNATELLNAGQEDIDSEVKKLQSVSREFAENTASSMAALDERLKSINDLLVEHTQKRGFFSRFKRRKT